MTEVTQSFHHHSRNTVALTQVTMQVASRVRSHSGKAGRMEKSQTGNNMHSVSEVLSSSFRQATRVADSLARVMPEEIEITRFGHCPEDVDSDSPSLHLL